jgi:hypothetical protein
MKKMGLERRWMRKNKMEKKKKIIKAELRNRICTREERTDEECLWEDESGGEEWMKMRSLQGE